MDISKTPEYVATARIQASSTPPGSDTEADSVLNRVKGIATSVAIVKDAIGKAGVTNRSAVAVAAHEVNVARLGSSAIFDLSVTDPSPAVAERLVSRIGLSVVVFLNSSGNQTAALMTQLLDTQSAAVKKREDVATKLQLATDPVVKAGLSAQLATLDEEIGNVASSVRQLQVTNVTGGSAAVISPPSGSLRVPSGLSTDAGLAAVVGLVVGLLLATLLEVLRPTVSGARPFAEQIGAPLLGVIPGKRRRDGTEPDVRSTTAHEAMVRIRRAAARRGVSALVLTAEAGTVRLVDLAAMLTEQLGSRQPAGLAVTSDRRPSSNGRRETELSDTAVTMTLPVVADIAADRLRVLTLSEVDGGADTDRYGLLVLVAKRTSFAELRRVADLSEITGWPVIGVLGGPTGRGVT
ncbi:hypothetical protein [Fodinicola acaciae]|uniref:hypothetical protein n=1 Tax=Fodinicola acaciae TaxID=2681555 RepID=UPI0013D1A265|nr:hypothetical protein [Fodinicola acaciae]